MTRVTATAACIILGTLTGMFVLNNNPLQPDQKDLLSQLDLLKLDNNEIQLILDSDTININNKETVFLTDEGKFIISGDSYETIAPRSNEENVIMVVPNGKKTNVRFSDGTSMWINSGSKILYPKTFSKDRREIYVDGEIYLDVMKDELRPFIVHTSSFDVKVLGTRFNVSAHQNDGEKAVILVNGSVEISLAATKQKTRLSPSDGFFLRHDSICTRQVDTYLYTCWLDDVLKLEDESLSVIFDKLSRIYNVSIHYNKMTAMGRYKGKLNLNDSIEKTIYNLSLATLDTPFSYTIKGNNVNIKFK
jgi:hypothetical protein